MSRISMLLLVVMLVGCRSARDELADRIGDVVGGDVAPVEEEGIRETRSYKIKHGEAGLVEFETYGIVHLDKPRGNNGRDVERFFFAAEGKRIKKMLLYQAMGNGRSGRTYISSSLPKDDPLYFNHKKCGAFTDNLPDWHEWEIKWGDGKLSVELNGKPIPKMKKPMVFHGVVEKIYVGGCGDWRRFEGLWRNLRINGEAQ